MDETLNNGDIKTARGNRWSGWELLATRILPRLTVVSAALTTFLSVIVLLRWMKNSLRIALISGKYIPMAPTTAFCFALLGTVLIYRQWQPVDRGVQHVLRALAGIVLLLSVVFLLQFAFVSVTALPLDIEQWIVPSSVSEQGQIIGRMSPLTALLLILFSSAILLSLPSRDADHGFNRVAEFAAVVVFLLAGVLVIGYWYDAPLLYGGPVTPVAFTTAIGFVLLSGGFLFNNPKALFYRWVMSDSVFSRFTRLVLPGTIGIILIVGWAHLTFLAQVPPVYEVLYFFLSAFFTAGLITFLTIVVARKVQAAVTRAEQKLRESEERFRQMFDNMSNCVTVYEAIAGGDDFIIKDFNWAAEQVEGLSKKNVLGRSVLKVFPGVKEFGLFEVLQRVWKTGKPESHPVGLYKDNRIFGWRENFVYKLPCGQVVAIYDDVTARKQVEEALRESENRFRILFEQGPDGVVILDPETTQPIEFNDRSYQQLGYTREEFGRLHLPDIEVVETAEEINTHIQKVLREGRDDFETRQRTKKGEVRNVYVTAQMIELGGRSVYHCVWRDITERKETEKALQRSEDEARRLANENAIIAEVGRVISSTLDIEEVYGHFAEEVKKIIPYDRLDITSSNFQDQTVIVAYVAGQEVSDRNTGNRFSFGGSLSEELSRRRSGILIQSEEEKKWAKRFPAVVSMFRSGIQSMLSIPLFSHDQVIGGFHLESLTPHAYTEEDLKLAERVGNQIAGAIANAQLFAEHERVEIEKLSLQDQLRQSQKMEAIGQLAGGVAHDFNNLLTVISVQAQLGLRGLREGDPLKEKLKDIELAADRAANLTRQLLAFSRRQILEMKVINLNFILKDMEKMLRRVIGEDIELKAVLADDLGLVKVDPGQMEQVIVNLAVNAKDAMPQGGKLLLETANAELDEEYVHSHVGMIPGAYVLLSITDTGVGMSKEVKEQIFDPFFTTKEKGKGTGLGLSTVYGIVKQSGGDIYVDSEEGKGTTFKVYLPRVFEPQEEIKKEAREELPRGTETIVVVEDARMVRKLAVDILRKQGYRVLEAEAGGEGLLICEQYQEPIDLILTDVVMPKMSGSQFIERLRQVRKDFKVLYMTGYTDEAILRQGILEEGIELIHKPFTIEKLARKVREVLDKK